MPSFTSGEAHGSHLKIKSGVLPLWQAYGCFDHFPAITQFSLGILLVVRVPGTLGPVS
jgi:hypothetical protein